MMYFGSLMFVFSISSLQINLCVCLDNSNLLPLSVLFYDQQCRRSEPELLFINYVMWKAGPRPGP